MISTRLYDETDTSLSLADINRLRMKKSKSVDIGKLRRQALSQSSNEGSDNSHAASKFSHDLVFGRYALRQSTSSRGTLHLSASNPSFECDSQKSECNCSSLNPSPSEPERFEEDAIIKRFAGDRRKWTVGRVSVFMLVLFTLTDFVFQVVNAQMQTLESPDHYDALSTEVIRPAFRYHSSNVDRIDKPRLGLGTAAISSVTTALSPILPFTGGLDLRREDYWTNGWFGSVSSVAKQVRDAFSMGKSQESISPAFMNTARGGAQVKTESSSKKSHVKAPIKHSLALSDTEPFVPVEQVSDLTLRDVGMAFNYAMESTRDDFNRGKFFQGTLPRVKNVMEAMTNAAAKSAGKGVKFASTSGALSTKSGDIDALHFCAAMRIFAEWRLLRQVPEGYKGYAVGMSLGHKDVVQNVAKIEQATHTWIDHHSCSGETCESRSPTLRDLLQFEVETDVHDNTKLPRLKERTGAMGLLWARRQLQYQTAIFSNVLKVPNMYGSAKDAVSAAYAEVYNKYHGWAVQKIFNYSFQAAPDAGEIYKVMNPHRLREVQESARREAYHQDDGSKNKFPRWDGNRNRSRGQKDTANPVGKLFKHVGKEWDKFSVSVVELFGGQPAEIEMTVRGGEAVAIEDKEIQIQKVIMEEMAKDALENIRDYLDVAQPILTNLAALFDELNMDDPTKV